MRSVIFFQTRWARMDLRLPPGLPDSGLATNPSQALATPPDLRNRPMTGSECERSCGIQSYGAFRDESERISCRPLGHPKNCCEPQATGAPKGGGTDF